MRKTKESYRDFVLMGMFAAIIFLLIFTPIGFINLVVIKATVVHLPVIIGAILLGPKKGAVLGGLFGVGSLIANSTTPTALSFAFSPLIPVPGGERGSPLALVVCFLPRILVGVVPVVVYRLLARLGAAKNSQGKTRVLLAFCGVLGALTNTVLVMGMIYLFFRDAFAVLKGIPHNAVLGVVLGIVGTNGVPEAIFAAVLTALICPILLQLRNKGKTI